MVSRALAGLPSRVKERLKNVVVCVEQAPSKEQLKETGTRKGDILLGLFEGIPETEWGKGLGAPLPDKITIFQEGIEHFAKTREEVEKEVADTVRHEVAHYFGWSDEELEKM
ncbi:MAG: metallopeptidase family protein [Candidatus Wildermuthbacteria bacterium]|nr:metallopeptidase family protein [Candidatus Wildermuthbacteria bacterium]